MCLYDTLMSCQNDFPLLLVANYPEICRNIQSVLYNSELSVVNFMHQGYKLIFTYVADQGGVFLSEQLKINEYIISKRSPKCYTLPYQTKFVSFSRCIYLLLWERSGLICVIFSYVSVTPAYEYYQENLSSLVLLTNHIFSDVKLIIHQFFSVPLSNWQVLPPTLDTRFPTSFKCAYLKTVS